MDIKEGKDRIWGWEENFWFKINEENGIWYRINCLEN